MGAVIILTPVVVGAWPIISAAVTAAAAGLGLNVVEKIRESVHEHETQQEVEIELENSQVLSENVASDKELVLNADGITLRVTRDARGQCKIHASGNGYSQAELKQKAEAFSQRVSQCFVYNRTVTELKRHNFQTVNEDVTEDGTIRVHVRRWMD